MRWSLRRRSRYVCGYILYVIRIETRRMNKIREHRHHRIHTYTKA